MVVLGAFVVVDGRAVVDPEGSSVSQSSSGPSVVSCFESSPLVPAPSSLGRSEAPTFLGAGVVVPAAAADVEAHCTSLAAIDSATTSADNSASHITADRLCNVRPAVIVLVVVVVAKLFKS